MKLYYLGPEGSYSHEAAKKFVDKYYNIELEPKEGFYNIFKELETDNGKLALAILPVENSTEGSVLPVIDFLYKTEGLNIICEIVMDIKHVLYGNVESVEQLEIIYSHPQAIGQCREYFKCCPSARFINTSSTSEAAKKLTEIDGNVGAIAGPICNELYGLKILDDNITDNIFNQTRFLLIANREYEIKPLVEIEKTKVSLAFNFRKDKSGNLYEVLGIFAKYNINLSKIESRPAKNILGEYVFFIDFDGHLEDMVISNVMYELRKITRDIKIIGKYKSKLIL